MPLKTLEGKLKLAISFDWELTVVFDVLGILLDGKGFKSQEQL